MHLDCVLPASYPAPARCVDRDGACGEMTAMPLVDLVVVACAVANPAACRDYHLVFEWEGTLRACAMQAETRLEQWNEEHPNLHVTRWRCAWPSQEDEKS